MDFQEVNRYYTTTVKVNDLWLDAITIPAEALPVLSDSLKQGSAPFNRQTLLTAVERTFFRGLSSADAESRSGTEVYGTDGMGMLEFAAMPIVVFEQSPPSGVSLNTLADLFKDVPGAAVAVGLTGASPWLIVTIPLGIICFRVSQEVGTAVGEVLGDWIRELKPRKDKLQE